jgi:hypothetical protein
MMDCTEIIAPRHAPGLLEIVRRRLLEWLDRQHMRIVDQHVDAIGVGSDRSG